MKEEELSPLVPRLEALFREECSDHLASIRAALRSCRSEDDICTWSELHQELDSLANAARAINECDTEELGRCLATLVRYARDHEPVRERALELVAEALAAIGSHCLALSDEGVRSYAEIMADAGRLMET